MEKRPQFLVLDTMNYWMNNTLDELKQVIGESRRNYHQ